MRPYSKILSILIFIICTSIVLISCSDNSQLVQKSSENKPWFGVRIKDISERRLNNLKLDYGIEIVSIYENSPAEKAGLVVEDILLSFDGEPLTGVDDLVDGVEDTKIDDDIKITYLRNGKEKEAKITITGKHKRTWKKSYGWFKPDQKFKHKVSIYENEHAWLGVSTNELTAQLRQYFDVPQDIGVLVIEVAEDSPAKEAGIKAGDIIISIEGKEIQDYYALIKTLDRYDPEDEIEISVIRERGQKTIKVVLGKQEGRFRHHYSFFPNRLKIYVPDMDIEIPEFDIEIPEIDEAEIRELNERIREEIEINTESIEEHMEELDKHLEELNLKLRKSRSRVI